MNLVTWVGRWANWFLYCTYGNIVFYCDLFLSYIGSFASLFLQWIFNNPLVDTVNTNINNLVWILVPLAIAGGAFYYLLSMHLEDGYKIFKGCWYFLVAILLINPLVDVGQKMTNELVDIAPKLTQKDGQQPSNGMIGLTNTLFSVNPEFESCKTTYANSGLKSHTNYQKIYDSTLEVNKGRWVVGATAWQDHIGPAKIDLTMASVESVVAALNGYPLEPDGNKIIGDDEKLDPSGSVVHNRYMHTACADDKVTWEDKGIIYNNSNFHFKWELQSYFFGLALALILLIGCVMVGVKVLDLGIEFVMATIMLPITAINNIIAGGWSEMFSNNVKAVFKTALAIFLQIFAISFVALLYKEGYAWISGTSSVVGNGGVGLSDPVSAVLTPAGFGWAVPFLRVVFIAIFTVVFFFFTLNGSDKLVEIFGIDTGVNSSGAAAFATGMITSKLASAGGKMLGGAGKLAKKGAGKLTENAGNGMEYIKQGARNARANNEEEGIADKGNMFKQHGGNREQAMNNYDNLSNTKKANVQQKASEHFNKQPESVRRAAFENLGQTSHSGNYNFNELSKDTQTQLGKRYYANSGVKNKTMNKAKSVTNGASAVAGAYKDTFGPNGSGFGVNQRTNAPYVPQHNVNEKGQSNLAAFKNSNENKGKKGKGSIK